MCAENSRKWQAYMGTCTSPQSYHGYWHTRRKFCTVKPRALPPAPLGQRFEGHLVYVRCTAPKCQMKHPHLNTTVSSSMDSCYTAGFLPCTWCSFGDSCTCFLLVSYRARQPRILIYLRQNCECRHVYYYDWDTYFPGRVS